MSRADAIKTLSNDPKYNTPSSSVSGTSGAQAAGSGDLGAKLDKLIKEQSKTNELLSAIVQLANTFAKEGIKANVNGAAMPQSGAGVGAMAASTVGAGTGVEGNFNRVGTTDISNYQSIIDNMNSIALR